MPRVRGVRRVVLSAVAASVFVAMSGVDVAHAVTAPTWGVAVPATFATDIQNTNPDARFRSVSCVSAGNCTAAGSFTDLAGSYQAFTQTSTGGTWGVAVPATFGAGIQNTNPSANFYSVSCVSAGNCTAAGSFKDFVGSYQAFTQTSTDGVWAESVPATFGAGIQNTNPSANFFSVSCVSAGNCTAAGRFEGIAEGFQAFTQTSTDGVWADAVPATFPATLPTNTQNTNPSARFRSVSCVSAGYCTAAGYFKDFAGSYQAFTQTSTGGTWADAVPASFGTGIQNTAPDTDFHSVSCVSAGYCTAAGSFYDFAGSYQAFTQTSTGGTWAVAVPASFGTDVQNANPNAVLYSVSCVSAGNCTAAGYFKDLAENRQAFTQTSTGSGTPLLPPTGANTIGFVAVAVVLVAAGSVLVATRRRRTISA